MSSPAGTAETHPRWPIQAFLGIEWGHGGASVIASPDDNSVLTDEQRHRLAVVLVRARNPNNIGAVARAMHNFGFTDLRLVNDYSLSLDKARSAVDASSILTSAREFLRVEDAVADCNLVVGTTAIGERKQEHPLRTLAEGAPYLLSTLQT